MSALYVGLIVAAILTIFLLVFIAQNSDSVAVKFLGFEGQISLAVALLLSAVIGVLVVAVPGSLRIVQLRRALRKNANT
ncbi:MAG: lipopolysaccharide assembly protein LapA domain-containing protein [Aeromicrobium sp.]|uniref:LapA family protein n=1 Tax=Aeromicrobium sp. TaxID=1871063 RepID=UPI003C33EDED